MIEAQLNTDYHLLKIDEIVAVHQYPTIVEGFEVWNNNYSDSYDKDGKFNRWIAAGPFAKLEELLENLNLMDNKIAIEYKNGIFIGFYDNSWSIGTKCWHIGEHNRVVNHEIILQKYEAYKNRCKKLHKRPIG